jgi:hypothetical protein
MVIDPSQATSVLDGLAAITTVIGGSFGAWRWFGSWSRRKSAKAEDVKDDVGWDESLDNLTFSEVARDNELRKKVLGDYPTPGRRYHLPRN